MNRGRLLPTGILAGVAFVGFGGAAYAADDGTVQTVRIATVLIVYCATIVAGSLVGGWLPLFVKLTHNRMQLLISFVGGLMLGIGVLHLLPHAAAEISVERTALWMMAGIVTMFFLLRFFHFHHHEPPELIHPEHTQRPHDHEHGHDHKHEHEHDHGHDHGREHDAGGGRNHKHEHGDVHRFSWMGILLGLGIHTLIDGVALGASVRAESVHGAWLGLFGLGTFLAILLHKPLDALSITSLMAASGWSAKARNIVNASFAAMCPLGAVLFLFGVEHSAGQPDAMVGAALAFSGGVFVCIALSDLLPEMELHSHNRVQLTMALLAGILLAWLIGTLEPAAHQHGNQQPEAGVSAGRERERSGGRKAGNDPVKGGPDASASGQPSTRETLPIAKPAASSPV